MNYDLTINKPQEKFRSSHDQSSEEFLKYSEGKRYSFFHRLQNHVVLVVLVQLLSAAYLWKEISPFVNAPELFSELTWESIWLPIVLCCLPPTGLLIYLAVSLRKISDEIKNAHINGLGEEEGLHKPFLEEAGVVAEFIEKCVEDLRVKNKSVKELKSLARDLARDVETDTLTGLLNRKFLETLSEKYECAPVNTAVIMLDLDRFKNINDTFGHDVGDEVLKELAQRIKENISHSDNPIRLGGDEFCIILDWKSKKNPLVMAERLRQKVREKPFSTGYTEIVMSISVGISDVNRDEGNLRSFSELLKQADTALYAAKHSGRNKCKTYEPSMSMGNQEQTT